MKVVSRFMVTSVLMPSRVTDFDFRLLRCIDLNLNASNAAKLL